MPCLIWRALESLASSAGDFCIHVGEDGGDDSLLFKSSLGCQIVILFNFRLIQFRPSSRLPRKLKIFL